MRAVVILSMFWNSTRMTYSIMFSSILASLLTIFALSINASAQDAPDYLLGNLTLDSDLTPEQVQEIGDKITNYTSTMLKGANGNITRMNELLIEDMAKRNIIDEEAKEDYLSFIASLPKSPMEAVSGTTPGNLTIPGNVTDILKDLDTSSELLDEITMNGSDSQMVTLMNGMLKEGITDFRNVISGNVTDVGLPPMTIFSESDEHANLLVTCGLIAGIAYGPGLAMGGVHLCHAVVLMEQFS